MRVGGERLSKALDSKADLVPFEIRLAVLRALSTSLSGKAMRRLRGRRRRGEGSGSWNDAVREVAGDQGGKGGGDSSRAHGHRYIVGRRIAITGSIHAIGSSRRAL